MSLLGRLKAALVLAVAVASPGCSHTRPPEAGTYAIADNGDGVGGSGSDHCADEQIACFDRCWNSRPPLSSIRKGSEKHHEYCTTKCLDEYMNCVKEQETSKQFQKLHFPDTDKALSWLREHKTEIAVGTLVVVAGATFIVATGGSGALILVPLL
jgi:hypothetical protein